MFGGAITSVAANVAHVFVPPTGWDTGVSGRWVPPVGAVLGAVVWPLALLVASEVLARKRFASRWTRLLGTLAVLVVALVAAVISYQHLHDLLLYYRETELSAAIGPLGIDGLMVVCSVALVAADTPADTPAPVLIAAANTPRSVTVTAPVTDTRAELGADTADADTLRARGVHTLRGAMAELGAGRARAQRALDQAWPDTQ